MNKTRQRFEKWRGYLPGGLIILGGLFLLLFRLNHESVWNDEIFTWELMNGHSFSDSMTCIIQDVHPPLYYLMLKVFCLIGGNSIFTIRLFSVLGALSLAALGLGPVRRACGNKTALLYSCLVFLMPAILGMAQEARMYTWAAFFVTGTVLYAFLAATGGKISDWIKLGIFTLGSAYTHYHALVAVVIANFLLFVWLICKQRRRLVPFWITMGAVLIGYLPWLPAFIAQIMKVKRDYWISPISPGVIRNTLLYPFGDKFSNSSELFILQPFIFGLAVALILWGLWQTMIKKRTDQSPGLFTIGVYLGAILTLIIVSFLVRPILAARYTIVITGLFTLSLAIGLGEIPKKSVFWSLGILFLALSLPGLYQASQQRFNGPMEEVVAYLEPKLTKDAVFVHFDSTWQTFHTFCFYFPNHQHFLYLPERPGSQLEVIFSGKQGSFGSDLDSFLQGQKNIWFVTRTGSPPVETGTAFITLKKYTVVLPLKKFQLPYSWYGVEVCRVAPTQP